MLSFISNWNKIIVENIWIVVGFKMVTPPTDRLLGIPTEKFPIL